MACAVARARRIAIGRVAVVQAVYGVTACDLVAQRGVDVGLVDGADVPAGRGVEAVDFLAGVLLGMHGEIVPQG